MALSCFSAKEMLSTRPSRPCRAPHCLRHLLAHILAITSVAAPLGTGWTSGKTEGFCLPLFPFVSLCLPWFPCCFPFVSLCFPSFRFVSLLFPFCLPLFPFCVPFVSLLSPCCLPLSPCCLPAVSLLSPCCFPLSPCCSPVVPLLLGLVAGNTFTLQLRRRCGRIAFCLAGSQHTRNCR